MAVEVHIYYIMETVVLRNPKQYFATVDISNLLLLVLQEWEEGEYSISSWACSVLFIIVWALLMFGLFFCWINL